MEKALAWDPRTPTNSNQERVDRKTVCAWQTAGCQSFVLSYPAFLEALREPRDNCKHVNDTSGHVKDSDPMTQGEAKIWSPGNPNLRNSNLVTREAKKQLGVRSNQVLGSVVQTSWAPVLSGGGVKCALSDEGVTSVRGTEHHILTQDAGKQAVHTQIIVDRPVLPPIDIAVRATTAEAVAIKVIALISKLIAAVL